MGGLKLLDRARSAGLEAQAQDGRLLLEGPTASGDVAREPIARKAEVLAELTTRTSPDEPRWGPADGEDLGSALRPTLPSSSTWRPTVAAWPIPLLRRRGDLANELAEAGYP